jgi:hypothetical protein
VFGKVFEPYLNDTTTLGKIGRLVGGATTGATTEVRDVALAQLVHLTGQDHKDYGFAHTQASNVNPAMKFTWYYLGFINNEIRQAAFKKWQTYAAVKK